MAASSRSTSPPASREANWLSRSAPASSAAAWEVASICSTFSSMRSKAAMALPVFMRLVVFCSCSLALAALARALSMSFLVLASDSLLSRPIKLRLSCSTVPLWLSSCPLRAAAVSAWVFLRISACLASSSSPFWRASWARCCQVLASLLARSYCCCTRFWLAIAPATAWRICTKSSCISIMAWSRIFSGFSAELTAAFRLERTTRLTRSNNPMMCCFLL